jgi:hypothetical protein
MRPQDLLEQVPHFALITGVAWPTHNRRYEVVDAQGFAVAQAHAVQRSVITDEDVTTEAILAVGRFRE